MRFRTRCLVIVFLWLQHHHPFCQLPPDYKLISVAEGLSHRDVKYATRDPRGFLWVINSGIDFYDGQTFTSYNKFDSDHYIPIDNIRTGCKILDSLLVFTAAKDLYALNMLTGKVRPMPFPEGMNTDFNDIITIVDRQHHPNILIFTRSNSGTTIHVIDQQWKYLFHYDVENTIPLRTKILRSYANGPDDVLWLLDQANAQILRIDQQETKVIPFTFEVNMPNLSYRLVYLRDFGLILCRNDGFIFAVRDGTNEVKAVMQIPVSEPVLNPSHVTKDGWIWSLSDNQMVQFNVRTATYRIFDIKLFGLYHPILRGSYEDDEGITWIPSEVGLLEILPKSKPFHASCADPNSTRNFQFREILPGGPNSVFCRALGEKAVLLELTLDDQLNVDTINHLKNIPTNGVFQRRDEYLYHIVSGKSDLLRYHIPDFKMERLELPANATTQFYNLFVIDTSGMIYYQDMNNHLSGFHPETHDVNLIPLETTKLKSPWRVLQFFDHNQILIGTETAGLMFFDGLNGKLLRKFDMESSPALSGNFVNAVFQESDSILWVGTLGAGLNRINLVNGDNHIFTKLDGLPDNLIASILQDENQNLWIGTYGGLSMYSKTDERFYNYNKADGLSDNEFNYLSSYTTDSGIMLMGTLNGITIFNPAAIVSNAPLPPVQLTKIQRYNRKSDELITEDIAIDPNQVIRMSPYDNFLDLSFAVASYTNNASHIFFSRLKGVEIDWQNLGRTHTVRYQKLPPGNYELELMAADGHGNKTAHPTIVRIYVEQIFYKSFWFLSIVLTMILSAIWAMYRYRVRVLEKELETRTRIASDLHDEVGGSLTGLYLQMQMMEMKASEQEKSNLSKANTIINEAITKLRDLVWSIDARSDSWGRMMERMEDYASDVLSPLDIQFTFHHHLSLASPIDAKMKHNLYLIFKEALHNVAKHSNASKVDIQIQPQSDSLHFSIQDNGAAADRKNNSGQGLKNMQMRAERLRGKLASGFNDVGFRIDLEIPFLEK